MDVQVTPAERLQAAAQIGNETGILNVAFGTGVPQSVLQHHTAAAGQCQDRSVLEQELTQVCVLNSIRGLLTSLIARWPTTCVPCLLCGLTVA